MGLSPQPSTPPGAEARIAGVSQPPDHEDEDHDDDESSPRHQRFSSKSKHFQQRKMHQTAKLRKEQGELDHARLPVGEVVQVYSLYYHVCSPIGDHICTMRRTLAKLADTAVVVGDRVRFSPGGGMHELGLPEAVIERVEPRRTLLTRAESFRGRRQAVVVANADQMLIVAALVQPRVKWGLVDRMLIAARAGGLMPVICLNKIDLRLTDPEGAAAFADAEQVLLHYARLGYITVQTSAEQGIGLRSLRDILHDRVTVLAGHSGVGKSSLIRAVEPGLDISVGEISTFNQKGRHTTTSARRYLLRQGGAVVDTPGIKQFGLWQISADNLLEHFPDVGDGSAPPWRLESYQRILDSLGGHDAAAR